MKNMKNLPNKNHPIWKLMQSVIALIALFIFIYHGHEGLRFDMNDASGVVGMGVIVKLIYQFIKS